MRRLFIAGAACVVVALLAFLLWQRETESTRRESENRREYAAPRKLPAPPLPSRVEAEGQPALSSPATAPAGATEARRSPLLDRLGAPATKPEAEPQIVHDALDAYRRTLGGFPAGEGNRQILNALRGANPQKLPFVPGDHPRLNARGELLDAWGTPFFFHAISRDVMEVRSAGADRELYTADDLVAGTPPRRPARPTVPTAPPAK